MAPPLTPVDAAGRLDGIDALRGVAVLGILVMNIQSFALSAFAFFDPTLDGWSTGADRFAWMGSHLLFDMKMMAVFSMLFGAGLVIFTERKQRRAFELHARRMGWLLLFGFLHGLLLWEGDILLMYAICGFAIYPCRRLPPGVLVGIAIPVLLVPVVLYSGFGHLFEWMRDAAASRPESTDASQWNEVAQQFQPTAEMLASERDAFLGSYADNLQRRVGQLASMIFFMFPTWGFWRITGLMLLGIALMRSRLLNGERPRATAALGASFLVGFPLVVIGMRRLRAHDFDIVEVFKFDWHFNYVGSILVAIGYIGLVLTLSRKSAWFTRLLAPVGRLALTNYLAQTLICVTIFTGAGLGWWGRLSRAELLLVVGAIWAFQILFSIVWTRRFRFGPLEWAWRSLTYWRLQPISRPAPEPASHAGPA